MWVPHSLHTAEATGATPGSGCDSRARRVGGGCRKNGAGLRGCSYRSSSGVECLEVGDQGVVDLTGEVALDAAHDLGFGQAFLGPPFDIGTGAGTEPHPDHGQVQRHVGVAVAAAVQPVPAMESNATHHVLDVGRYSGGITVGEAPSAIGHISHSMVAVPSGGEDGYVGSPEQTLSHS
jgi:hypothetical protein